MTLTCDDDRRIHSLHGYFLRAGDVHETTRWEVERVRDGRGFSHRAVRGVQNGRRSSGRWRSSACRSTACPTPRRCRRRRCRPVARAPE
ncbi:hypothetical protein HBB16_10300 [Pseudonocardia sp. MCCB 268]|nr:hypothetical protein [Pseudonocardia cytotoxica]